MAALTTSEMLVRFYHTTQHNIPEDCHLESPCVYNYNCVSSLDEPIQILISSKSGATVQTNTININTQTVDLWLQ
jgi:hypothetical protein